MAGDWIKIEMVTPDKPEVFAMAEILGIDPDAVTGKLFRFWSWCDSQSVDGSKITVSEAIIDRITHQPGFAAALRKVDWLQVRSGSLVVPNFDRHNGQTAKNRAVNNRRVAKHRKTADPTAARGSGKCNGTAVTFVTEQPLQKPLPEKRREEKKEEEDVGEVRTSLGKSKSTQPPIGASSAAAVGDGELSESEMLTAQGKYLEALGKRVGLDPEAIGAIVAGKNPPEGAFDAWLRNRAAEDWRTPRGNRPVGFANWSADLDRFLSSWGAKAGDAGGKPKQSGPPRWLPENWRDIAKTALGREMPNTWAEVSERDQDDIYNAVQREREESSVPAMRSA